MFGAANQLLATIALAIGTSFIINRGKARYAWCTIIPMLFVGVTTITAAIQNMINIYYPQLQNKKTVVQGSINLILTALILICVFIILADSVPRWIQTMRGKRALIIDEIHTEPEKNLI